MLLVSRPKKAPTSQFAGPGQIAPAGFARRMARPESPVPDAPGVSVEKRRCWLSRVFPEVAQNLGIRVKCAFVCQQPSCSEVHWVQQSEHFESF